VTGRREPVDTRVGQYVLLGAHGHTADWIGGVSAIVKGTRPQAFYQGKFLRLDAKRRAIFADGTVLSLAATVKPPAARTVVSAVIDVRRHEIVEVAPL